MKLFTTKEQIVAAIKSISTRGAKLDADIWTAATSAMAHHAEHGDVTLINELIDAMPKGSRVVALVAFIAKCGKVTYDADAKTFLHDKSGEFNLEKAMSKSWVEYKPEQPYRPFDVMSVIKAAALKAQAERKEGDKCTATQAKALLKLAAELGIDLTAKK